MKPALAGHRVEGRPARSASGALRFLNVRFECDVRSKKGASGQATCVRSDKGASGQAAALHWSGLRCASAALRCSVSWPRRRTRFVRFAHCTQTAATSQMLMRAARAATSPALLGAPEARCSLPVRAFADTPVLSATKTTIGAARQAVPGGGDFCGGEKRRPGVGAHSALRDLTRRGCLSAVSAANEASPATRPRAEHRSAVGAQRRPPQHEPAPGTACRAAQQRRKNGDPPTAATSRQPPPKQEHFTRRAWPEVRWRN